MLPPVQFPADETQESPTLGEEGHVEEVVREIQPTTVPEALDLTTASIEPRQQQPERETPAPTPPGVNVEGDPAQEAANYLEEVHLKKALARKRYKANKQAKMQAAQSLLKAKAMNHPGPTTAPRQTRSSSPKQPAKFYKNPGQSKGGTWRGAEEGTGKTLFFRNRNRYVPDLRERLDHRRSQWRESPPRHLPRVDQGPRERNPRGDRRPSLDQDGPSRGQESSCLEGSQQGRMPSPPRGHPTGCMCQLCVSWRILNSFYYI